MSDLPRGLLSGSADLQSALVQDFNRLPFLSELSLAPLIRFWTECSEGETTVCASLARLVAAEVEKAPELRAPIRDAAVIGRHPDLVDVLMSAVFPPAAWEQGYLAAMVPFQLRGFYATPPMRRLLMSEDGELKGRVNLDDRMIGAMRAAYAYALILRRIYGIEVELDHPIILTVDDPATGLERHFRIMFDWQFVDVEVVGEVPPLAPDMREGVYARLLDPDRLAQVVPPDRFLFRGVSIFKAVEVTDQEVLSAIKRDLIDRESIVSTARFLTLQQRLRTLFRRPDLRFGLAAIDGDRILVLNYGSHFEHSCIFADSRHHRASEFAGSIYDRAIRRGGPLIIDDLAAERGRTPADDEILKNGVRAVVVSPLYYQDRIIGELELSSPHPGDFDARHLPKLHEVLPLFAMAVQRSMDELNDRIQTRIKEKFTAIHPVVEWRFRKAVLDSLERHGDLGGVELEPIVFDDVYPLYALSDIRGSSTQRELAVHTDLLTQLGLARDVVRTAYATRALPALDQLVFRIDRHAAELESTVHAADEGIVTFLRTDVEPLFAHLETFGPEVRARVEVYRAALDPRLGVVYRQRRVFDESVARISETISSYLDLEEQAAQSIFPHYFEKQKTDGVDHQLYVGGSLVEGNGFDPLYLRSLRLWQLMVVCGVVVRADRLAAELPLPMRTTHLVLVQNMPLSIRFRFDEKRFDVDGAYDVRYEIVKKRIDKALVKGTTDRVTQPGQIAIVYSQGSEAVEYRGYIEYLQHHGYLGPVVEELELEELQGVHGLRALRVTVALKSPDADGSAARDALQASAL